MNEAQIATAVIGLTQTIKMGGLPSKYLPAVAVVLGVALSLTAEGLSVLSGMKGLIIGLSATGLVNRADHYINGKKKSKRKPAKFVTKAISKDEAEKPKNNTDPSDAENKPIENDEKGFADDTDNKGNGVGRSEGGGDETTVPTTPNSD